jgi:hypothetical protein
VTVPTATAMSAPGLRSPVNAGWEHAERAATCAAIIEPCRTTLRLVVLRCTWLYYVAPGCTAPGCTASSHGRTRTILPCSTVRAQAGRVDEALELYQRMARER